MIANLSAAIAWARALVAKHPDAHVSILARVFAEGDRDLQLQVIGTLDAKHDALAAMRPGSILAAEIGERGGLGVNVEGKTADGVPLLVRLDSAHAADLGFQAPAPQWRAPDAGELRRRIALARGEVVARG